MGEHEQDQAKDPNAMMLVAPRFLQGDLLLPSLYQPKHEPRRYHQWLLNVSPQLPVDNYHRHESACLTVWQRPFSLLPVLRVSLQQPYVTAAFHSKHASLF